jgi:hypothetical protein
MSNEKTDLMQSMFGVFGKKAEDTVFKKEPEAGGVLFSPDPKNSPGQTFRGVVKFIPNLNDLEHMTVQKVSYWISDGAGFRFDSAKSVSKYEHCPVADKYWELKGSDDARVKALAENIRYSSNTFALVQVIKDLTNPENDGKFMVWNLPVAIQKKITAIMYPTKEDVDMGAVANNIFDPINGVVMTLKIPIKTVTENGRTSEYRDYDECKFEEKLPKTIILTGQKSQVVLSEDATELQAQKEQIIEAILAGPNLQDYAYKTPSEDQMKRVLQSLANISGQPLADDKPAKTDAPAQQAPAANDAHATNEAPVQQATATNVEIREPAQQAPAATAPDADAELLKSLGIDTE